MVFVVVRVRSFYDRRIMSLSIIYHLSDLIKNMTNIIDERCYVNHNNYDDDDNDEDDYDKVIMMMMTMMMIMISL